jgi:hypothetical protein
MFSDNIKEPLLNLDKCSLNELIVGVLDSRVSRSTCSWATLTAHLLRQGAGSPFKPNKEDPREVAPHEKNDT